MSEPEKSSDRGPDSKLGRALGRRDALKMGAVSALGTLGALTGYAKAAQAAGVGASGKKQARFAMVIDLRRCTGCHSCAVACKAEYNVPLGVWRSWVKIKEHGSYPKTSRAFPWS